MEIFCRHLPDQIPEKRLKKSFDEILQDVTYECRKLSRGCATLTFCDARKGQTLLDRYGPQRLPLLMFGKFILLSRSRNSPDQFLLRNLEETESKRRQRGPKSVITDISAPQLETSFNIKSLSCGLWDYDENGAVFINYFRRNATGHVVFGRSCLKISLIATSWPYSTQHVECDYSILSAPIYLGDSVAPTVTFSLESAPRLFGTSIMATLQTMTIKDRRPSKARISSLDTDHRILAATCFVYQLTLMQSTDLQRIQALKRERHIPKLFPWVTPTIQPRQPYRDIMTSFLSSLDRQPLPYGMKYQLQMLVWNGVLSPTKVTELFTQAHQIVRRSGLERGVQVFQALAKKVQYAGPEVNRSEFDTVMLAKVISELEAAARRGGSIRLELGEFNPNNVYVHKATVTPVGTYLYGPYWESKNRVLRRYASYTDYFLRVEFSEETGDPMRFDQNASLDEIFQGRFKSVLKDGFRIAGRHFEFLGFSHSSLRSHTCWFMAPFTLDNGEVLDARNIITQLGDFSVIRSPARCAARIGQAFSETLTSIEIPRRIIEISEDVKRNGRVFSDGVGTLSRSLTHRIWEEHTPYAKLKPTVFQIRLAGAKGMVSLDSTLNGDALMLRRSMVKFEASDLWNIEICGAGSRPLPLFLNRPLIKILEDLGVPSSAFVDLQKEETDRLRAITQSPLLAANFFEKSNVVKSTKLPWLIRALDRLGIHYSDDDFVRQAIELAVVVRLHELKYRSRICVEQGITLYGIMDETGFLREGEVYCVYCPTTGETQGKQVLVRNKVVITRSPALHPGDVQLVNAVDVPKDSPLNHLRNCIVFSQHGARDLPSQLSGGDLDGDLYNIIYDERLKLKRLAAPADYDRAPEFLLDRPVAKGDIIDFFITFMQQDQLGRIAMLHQAIADQKPLGTFDSDCVLLAEMHSTAVDFSKTGHPVRRHI
ncbi:MAG: hypothetical protein M1816_006485 [Peltula sp. TS41687]|nr:MAG: hypothetical protein M1816_006485 [Peltula sp. TS41687]